MVKLFVVNINNDDIKSIFYSITKEFIIPKFRNLKNSDIKKKNNNDFVTSVDLEVEKKLNYYLKKILPKSLFIGEELFEKNTNIVELYNEKSYCWTVDPIDGTKNFINGKEKFAIMISLTFKDTILQSWIYKPITEEMFFAINGEGSFLNNNILRTNNIRNINNSIGSISLKYWNNNYQCIAMRRFTQFK